MIDPFLIFGSYLGGGERDRGYGIAVDGEGNVYVTGETYSTDFPVTPGAFQTIGGGGTTSDAFVTKINAAGDAIGYSTYLLGDAGDQGYDIEVDSEGQAFVAGQTGSLNFPTTPGALMEGRGGFVTKLSADGSDLIYSTTLGTNTQVYGLEIDADGRAYVAGFSLQSGQFPATKGSFQPDLNGNGDGIIGVLNEDGSDLVWGSHIGGSDREFAYDVALDEDGYVYVTGLTPSDDFPTVNAFQNTKAAHSDAFVAKVTPDGSALVYSTYLGGDGGGLSDIAFGIAADDSGNAYVTGQTTSDNFPTTNGSFQEDPAGSTEAFVTKFGPNGNLVYSTYLGGSNVERGADIAADGDGSVTVAGYTYSIDFPTHRPFQAANAGDADGFVTKLDPSGSVLVYSTYLGGSDGDWIGETGGNADGGALAIDASDNAYVVGWTRSDDFPTMLPFQPEYAGEEDAFVVKLLGEGFLWGDVDCDSGVQIGDALKTARYLISLEVTQTQPCPAVGGDVNINGTIRKWVDFDCDGNVSIGDALKIARHLISLSVSQTQPCPAPASIIQVLE